MILSYIGGEQLPEGTMHRFSFSHIIVAVWLLFIFTKTNVMRFVSYDFFLKSLHQFYMIYAYSCLLLIQYVQTIKNLDMQYHN